MSSVTRFLKQIPSDTPYFIHLPTYAGSGNISLNIWVPDANASIQSYASGYAAGQFSTTSVAVQSANQLFRDMGKTIVSAGRTFRRIQSLQLDGTGAEYNPSFAPTNEGVIGGPVTGAGADSSFACYYFEAGHNGLGLAAPFVRYG
jgi:hypothetical protein